MEKRIRTLGGILCLVLGVGFGWWVYRAAQKADGEVGRKAKVDVKQRSGGPLTPALSPGGERERRKGENGPGAPGFADFAVWGERFLKASTSEERGALEK